MSFNRYVKRSQKSNATSSLGSSLSRLVGKRVNSRERRQQVSRRILIEQLESRQLMALNILSLSPADNSLDAPNDANLVITFNETVLKGQGNIYVALASTGTLGQSLDVNSSRVGVTGSVVTIDLPFDLPNDETYSVYIDSGAFIDASMGKTAGATLFTQNFDLLPLGPFVSASEGNGDGTDFTKTPPLGTTIDNSLMGIGGVPEWSGWSFADKNSWIASAGDQARSEFTLGRNTVAVADPDEWDDQPRGAGQFNSFLVTRPIDLSTVSANSISLEFDSSFRPEDPSVGKVQFTIDSGANWTDLLTFPPTAPDTAPSRNQHIVVNNSTPVTPAGTLTPGGYAINNPLVTPATGAIQFRWGLLTGENDWWWAVDNLKVAGEITGVPFAGISDPTSWNFTTPDSLALSVSIDKSSISENGGAAVGTVTRNKQFANPLTVTLASNDTTEATVPMTVTILAGESSATFPITAVDDLLSDRTQRVTISASDATLAYAGANTFIDVLDDEGPKVVALTPTDGASAVDYRTNFVITFDAPVKKGNGLINILRVSDNVLVASVDVNGRDAMNNPIVTISGSTVTIDPLVDLPAPASYYILMDDGTFLDTTTNVTTNTILMSQNFDLLQLGPFTGGEAGGDGTDVTRTPPQGFLIDNSAMSGGLTSNWYGWTFADPSAWSKNAAPRNQFTLGSGVIAVADARLWGLPDTDGFNSLLTTAPISLDNVDANSVSLEFDAAYLGDFRSNVFVQVSYNNAAWVDLAVMDGTGINNHILINSSGVTGSPAAFNVGSNRLQNPASGTMRFRFSVTAADNNSSSWAIDNLKVIGQTQGVPFQGISDPTAWNFAIERPTLTVAIDRTAMSETGGTAMGTVTRNILSRNGVVESPQITVLLTSNDTSEATLPVSVIIPAGATSATFAITAVDDILADGSQVVTITAASAPEYLAGTATIKILDGAFSPADNSTAVPVSTNLVVTLDQPVVKGNGFVHLVRASDGKIGRSIDIRSSAVTVAGNLVTIDPPADLFGLSDYYVLFGTGAILYPSAIAVPGVTLLYEDFELLPLGPAVIGPGFNANGKDFTATAPSGFVVDNSRMPAGGVPEFTGWTFVDKTFWINEGGQDRNKFTLGSGTVAVGDTDEWDDTTRPSNFFNSLFSTSPIDLGLVDANSVKLEFDSSFRPEGGMTATLPANNQIGIIEVSYDGGTNWTQLLQLDNTNTTGNIPAAPAPAPANVNEHRSITVSNPNSGMMTFRFGLTGTNDYWWAIDNVRITGSTFGTPYDGTIDPTAWNFSTAEAQTLSVALNASSIVENGGTTIGTVTRNLGTTGDVVVSLVSSDPASATVPATVTILAGQASAMFTVTAVDDVVADGLKKLKISATALGFVEGSASLDVTDNEIVNVIISEIMFDPAGAEPRSEWIEVFNRGTVVADLSGWTFDDEDTSNWGAIPAGTLVQPGGSAVIYSSFFGFNTDTFFRNEWNVPANVPVAGIFWGVLDAAPTTTNEMLILLDAGKQIVDSLIDTTLPPLPSFPAGTNGFSIYLANPLQNNNDGSNWKTSVLGVDSARRPIQAGITVSEVSSSSSSNTTYAADWFELTNNGTTTVDITGWKVDDSSNMFSAALDLQLFSLDAMGVETPVTSIAAGQSVVFVEGTAATRTAFRTAWGSALPTGLLLGSYSGSGIGLSSGGDDVRIFDASGTLVTFVTFGAITPGLTFENTARLTGTISELSLVGKNSAVASAAGGEVGSPGRTATTFSSNDIGSPGQVPAAVLATVEATNVFYNNSSFDGGAGVSAADDTAVATDKQAYRAGMGVATKAHYTNYTRGINALMIDILNAGSAASLRPADFTFKVGNTQTPSLWATAPTPEITPRPGAGVNGANRVTFVWPDNVIQNTWLEVTVLANANTGLSAPQTYYWGNQIAEVGDIVGDTQVSISDFNNIRENYTTNPFIQELVTNPYDINRDRNIGIVDFNQARANQTNPFSNPNIILLNLPAASGLLAAAPSLVSSSPASDLGITKGSSTSRELGQASVPQVVLENKFCTEVHTLEIDTLLTSGGIGVERSTQQGVSQSTLPAIREGGETTKQTTEKKRREQIVDQLLLEFGSDLSV